MRLLRTLWLAIKVRIIWFVLTAAVITGAIFIFGPRSKQVGAMRRILADRVLDELIRDVERRIIKREIKKRIAVLDLDGDHHGFIADRIRSRLRQRGWLVEPRKSAWRKALEAAGISGPATSSAQAAEVAEQLDAGAAVFGRVEEFSDDGTHGAVRLQIALADAATGDELARTHYAAVWPAGSLDRVASIGAGWRLLIWLAVALALPLAAYPVARAALEQESNLFTFLLLFAMTALDVLAALVLLGFAVRTVWIALLVLAALAASGLYNYLVTNSYEKMRA